MGTIVGLTFPEQQAEEPAKASQEEAEPKQAEAPAEAEQQAEEPAKRKTGRKQAEPEEG